LAPQADSPINNPIFDHRLAIVPFPDSRLPIAD
jgi:hypothetical protein